MDIAKETESSYNAAKIWFYMKYLIRSSRAPTKMRTVPIKKTEDRSYRHP